MLNRKGFLEQVALELGFQRLETFGHGINWNEKKIIDFREARALESMGHEAV